MLQRPSRTAGCEQVAAKQAHAACGARKSPFLASARRSRTRNSDKRASPEDPGWRGGRTTSSSSWYDRRAARTYFYDSLVDAVGSAAHLRMPSHNFLVVIAEGATAARVVLADLARAELRRAAELGLVWNTRQGWTRASDSETWRSMSVSSVSSSLSRTSDTFCACTNSCDAVVNALLMGSGMRTIFWSSRRRSVRRDPQRRLALLLRELATVRQLMR